MTSEGLVALESDPDANRVVADYLRERPEIFAQHRELLGELCIPHESGEAVSLVERQVSVLRDENRSLKARFEDLVTIAADNEDLGRRLHELSLSLIEAPGIVSIITVLKERLQDDFGADVVALRVFADPAFSDEKLPEFLGSVDSLQRKFEEILSGRSPVCGVLNEGQQEGLFGGVEIGSAVVMPLCGRGWEGVLVAGSKDRERYRVDMGTELLTHLGDVATLALSPWVVITN